MLKVTIIFGLFPDKTEHEEKGFQNKWYSSQVMCDAPIHTVDEGGIILVKTRDEDWKLSLKHFPH